MAAEANRPDPSAQASTVAPSAATSVAASSATSSLMGDDERALLIRLELLLEREEALLVRRDATGLAALAEEREHVTERLGHAARARRAAPVRDAATDAELIERYRRLRQRHDVQAQIVRRHAEVNARAIGVLAQATGQANLYQADGRVAMRFVSV